MLYQLVFWMMLATWLVSLLYPWHPSWPKAKYLVHLPLALIPMWVVYELLMPDDMNIRVDLLLIIPAFAVALIMYAIRLIAFWIVPRRGGGQSSGSVIA